MSLRLVRELRLLPSSVVNGWTTDQRLYELVFACQVEPTSFCNCRDGSLPRLQPRPRAGWRVCPHEGVFVRPTSISTNSPLGSGKLNLPICPLFLRLITNDDPAVAEI